ncbi:MAG TPA: DoxX family protein [Anaerolineae bacterium]
MISMLDVSVLVLRVVLGVIFIFHGGDKVFGWFGGSGVQGLAQSLRKSGSIYPELLAWLAAGSELGGGVLTLIGLLTPFAASLTISTMIVAIVTVHFKNGFASSKHGYEYNLSLIGLALPLVLLGAGTISIDHLLGIDQPINLLPLWVIVILVLVIFGGIVMTQLSKRLGNRAV